jgi:hypothetical protein
MSDVEQCPACGKVVGMAGHTMRDDDGVFFQCQDPERAERVRVKWMEAWK